ncbi:SLC13 family permease [Halopseudomonas phragmitis]|uniref:Anion transporter n=2 Tax=Pseudomonadaceae TaxID=135621 RepID=A0A1V0B9U8_9GAMM|nr:MULTISPECIES: SLC13 family permease [Pseudomonadaceae]AQZ96716.1 anion transporter [Halopseudomonas phragmitis]RHW20745.1 anion transporter [Pseudomonas jilinensis]
MWPTYLLLAVFVLTYIGMALGRMPGMRLDRTGIALLAVVCLLVSGLLEVDQAGQWIDLPTLVLLMGLMIISAQFAAAGAYDALARRLVNARLSSQALLGLTIATAALLSALLANDIIAFAMAPIIAEGTRQRGLDPRPFLIGLACACNTGSAATLIGNPQNILIGQAGQLDFWAFAAVCAVPALLATLVVWLVVGWVWRQTLAAEPSKPAESGVLLRANGFSTWQTSKGVVAVLALLALFTTSQAKEISALLVAAILLMSRVQASRDMLGAVDWHLLLLFACLFIVTGSLSLTGFDQQAMAWLLGSGWDLEQPWLLAPLMLAGSNSVGNVPLVILMLSVWPQASEQALYAMALLSTLAGNLLIVGSLANIIVVERAAQVGVTLSFRAHARCGIPVTLISMALALAWLHWVGGF